MSSGCLYRQVNKATELGPLLALRGCAALEEAAAVSLGDSTRSAALGAGETAAPRLRAGTHGGKSQGQGGDAAVSQGRWAVTIPGRREKPKTHRPASAVMAEPRVCTGDPSTGRHCWQHPVAGDNAGLSWALNSVTTRFPMGVVP